MGKQLKEANFAHEIDGLDDSFYIIDCFNLLWFYIIGYCIYYFTNDNKI